MAKLPRFTSEQAAADWFATHDTAVYMSGLEEVKEKIPVRRTRSGKESVGLRVPAEQLKAIRKVAREKGVPYDALIRTWLAEKLRHEASGSSRGRR